MTGEFYRRLVERGASAAVVVDRLGRVVFANARARAVLGTDPVGRLLPGLFVADVQPSVAAFLDEAATAAPSGSVFFSGKARHTDGSVRVLEVTAANLLDDPEVNGLVLGLVDHTQAAEREEALSRRAMTDSLTGLPNRALLLDRLDELRRSGRPGALALLDLDGFKEINDQYGHQAGDGLLRVVASRLLAALPQDATASRFGGDEFVLLLPGVTQDEGLAITEAACAAVSQPVFPDVTVTVSAGVTRADEGLTSDRVLQQADVAMYAAKAAGRGRVLLSGPDVDAAAQVHRDLATALARAEADRARLQQESRTDALTGLANRRALDEALPRLEAGAARHGRPYSVLFVDLDRFGTYNHHHGDARGDRLLVELAGVLSRLCRATDTAYRKGGEEFVITLDDTESEEAIAVAERVRATVEALASPHGGHPDHPLVTVTVATATARPGARATDVLEAAAAAAYTAKDSGNRNTASAAPACQGSSARPARPTT